MLSLLIKLGAIFFGVKTESDIIELAFQGFKDGTVILKKKAGLMAIDKLSKLNKKEGYI
jgi:hypothetical protein